MGPCVWIDSLLALPLLRPRGHESIRARVLPCLEPHGRLAPRRLRHATDGRLRLATTVRVVARRHDHATHRGTPAHTALVTGASDLLVLVLDVPQLADRRAAPHLDDADATRGEPDLRVLAFLGHELRHAARRAHELRAATGLELHPVDRRAGRDVLERQAVAHARLGLGAGDDRVADLELVRREDVALLPVLVEQQGETGRAVRVVLDGSHNCGNSIFISLEVDDAVVALLAAAAVARGDAALRVAAGVAQLALGERTLGLLALSDLGEGRGLPETQDRRVRLVGLEWHCYTPSTKYFSIF